MQKKGAQLIGLILMVILAQSCATPLWADKERLVQTRWKLSDGIQAGEDIYFLSYYSLYVPGKVIIPLFVVTPEKYFFTDLSLYKVKADGSSKTDKTKIRFTSAGEETGIAAKSVLFGQP